MEIASADCRVSLDPIERKNMRRADIVRMIRPLQLALVLTPLIAVTVPTAVTRASPCAFPEATAAHGFHSAPPASRIDDPSASACVR
jgi:hypothetical protein